VRRARKDELPEIAAFMIGQFFEKEELQQMFRGIDEARARRTAEGVVQGELAFFLRYGGVFVDGDEISAAAAGIESRQMSLWKRLPFALQGSRVLKELSKPERALLKSNSRAIQEVHRGNWYRKYCKRPYCFTQFAVAGKRRGTGLARQMLEELFDHVQKQNDCIVLETFTPGNVPLYEHFGFQLMETQESGNGRLTEYRMLKWLHE